MARGGLRAVVATSSLDLGIDWAAVDLVLQVGAPKGASRLIQRIGRANHRLDEPSAAILVPANRFEVLECRAAIEAVRDNTLDQEPPRIGGLDVLAQHILGMACAAPFAADALYDEVRCAAPYAGLPRQDFDDALAFVCTGGYALKSYDRCQRLSLGEDGLVSPREPARGAAIPAECRHHRGRADAESGAAQRPPPGPGRGVFHPGARARRHLRLRRRNATFRRRPRNHGRLLPSRRRATRRSLSMPAAACR